MLGGEENTTDFQTGFWMGFEGLVFHGLLDLESFSVGSIILNNLVNINRHKDNLTPIGTRSTKKGILSQVSRWAMLALNAADL